MNKVRELEIIKAALEGDIIRQKDTIEYLHKNLDCDDKRLTEFKDWLIDTEKLLKTVSKQLYIEKLRYMMTETEKYEKEC